MNAIFQWSSVISSQVSLKVYAEFVYVQKYVILIINCSLLLGIDCVTDKLKATFSWTKNTLFCPQIYSPVFQNAENRILVLWNFKIFWAITCPDPVPPPPRHRKRRPTAPCWYSRLLYSNLLATSIFIETPTTFTNYLVCEVYIYSGIYLRELKHQRRRLQKRHFTIRTALIKLYRVYSISFNSTKNGKFFWSWILKNCIEVQEKKMKIVLLCSRPLQNVKIGSITS